MTGSELDPDALVPVRQVLERQLGLHLEHESANLRATLEARLRATGRELPEYLERLRAPSTGCEELRALAGALTVGETYFFRNPDQLAACAGVALPARTAARAETRLLRILSAGCASGEEVWTLAIMSCEQLAGQAGWSVSVTGIDVNRALLQRAERGRYSAWSLRQVTPAVRERWFCSQGPDWLVDPSLRPLVRFEERNLLQEDPAFWRADWFDLILFRNVSIYFTPAASRSVIERLTRSLAPGGFLFLGDAETLRGMPGELELRQSHGAFYYQRPPLSPAHSARPGSASRPIERIRELPGPQPGDVGWAEAIQRASERIAGLDQPALPVPPRLALEPAAASEILSLIGRERFDEALERLGPEPVEAELLLMRAAVLTNRGSIGAEEACEQLLARAPNHAGAHYLLALCRELSGDRAGAAAQDRLAIGIDPTFAMPHLHLGLIARRAKDSAAARTSLTRALALLPDEQHERIVLFGGGFDRAALGQLCRAELSDCEGAR